MVSYRKIISRMRETMPEIEQRNFLRAHGPALTIFIFGAVCSGVTNYILLKEGIASNTLGIKNQVKSTAVFEKHIGEYRNFRDTVLIMQNDVANAAADRGKLNIVLGKMDDTLDKVNYTLTNMNASYLKDIESINKRLDKAGL